MTNAILVKTRGKNSIFVAITDTFYGKVFISRR